MEDCNTNLYIPFRLRKGRSEAEDQLIDRLLQLPDRSRSRFIRRVLTTGDIEPVLASEFSKETEAVTSALDALASLWGDDEE